MKTLACFALPVMAAAAIWFIGFMSGLALTLMESGSFALTVIVAVVAIYVVARACDAAHRLLLFIESYDAPRSNRRRYTLPSDR